MVTAANCLPVYAAEQPNIALGNRSSNSAKPLDVIVVPVRRENEPDVLGWNAEPRKVLGACGPTRLRVYERIDEPPKSVSDVYRQRFAFRGSEDRKLKLIVPRRLIDYCVQVMRSTRSAP